MGADSEEWAAVRPSRVAHAAPVRAVATGTLLLIAVALVSVSLKPGGPVILYDGWNTVPEYAMPAATVVPQDAACESCMTRILKQHEPWNHAAYLDPEEAMSCVRGDCEKASTQAMRSAGRAVERELQTQGSGSSTTQQLTEAKVSRGADSTSMEQFSYDERELDKQQLQLNWKRAKTFAHYFGKPNPKRVDLVMTKWVPPLDPTGRPVPSWLTFEPTAMNSEQIASAAETADLSQLQGSTDSVWTPKHSLAAITQSLAEASAPANPAAPKAGATSPKADATASQADAAVKKPENCILQTSCHGCTGNGCHWCGGGSICAVSCPAALGAQTYTKLEQCDAETSTLSSQPAGSDVKTQGSSEDNSAPMKRVASAQERQRRNREELKDLVHLSSITAGNVLVDTDLAVEFKLRAQDVHSKDDPSGPSLAQALAPLDDEQTALNHRREMLYFRMETNIHPGERHSSGLPPGEGVGRMDNFVKPTTTWSLIGRPMTGWLHWGNENDGGFLNPAGGTQWNPAVVNPAENKKSWGRATSQYAAQHPASMAGGALFGT